MKIAQMMLFFIFAYIKKPSQIWQAGRQAGRECEFMYAKVNEPE